MKPPRRTVDLRQANRQALFRLIFLEGPIHRHELGQRTELSPGTVTNVISELLQEGVLSETGIEESDGGRPRTLLAINPTYGYLVGIDMGETHLQLELFDLALHKLGAYHQPLPDQFNSAAQYVAEIKRGIAELLAGTNIPGEQVLGVGIGVPGVVEHSNHVRIAAPMWSWQSVSLLEQVEAEISLPVYIDNGAKGMALAEAWFGAGRGAQDMAVILIGTGVGAGIITKGTLYRGATNSAGEWGHTKIALDGRPCRCGSFGCLEAYVGAPGILATFHQSAGAALPETQQAGIDRVLAAARNGDAVAAEALQRTARYLGAGLANLVNLFNPERIIIGGWAGMALGAYLLEDIRAFVRQYALPPSLFPLQISLCKFGEDAICTGAACLVLEEFISANRKFARRSALSRAQGVLP